MKRIEGSSTPNKELKEETMSKSKKDEKNPPFNCSPFCSLKKRQKSILKSCMPYMFSVAVKVRTVAVQTSSQCLKCPPCLKDIEEKSKRDNEIREISPKTSVNKSEPFFDDNKSIRSSRKETDPQRDDIEVKNKEISENSSVVDFPLDSNELKVEENITDELKAPTSDTSLSMKKKLQIRESDDSNEVKKEENITDQLKDPTSDASLSITKKFQIREGSDLDGMKEEENMKDQLKDTTSDASLSIMKKFQSREGSQTTLCEECPPCSKEIEKLIKHSPGELDSTSTQTSASSLSNKDSKNAPYIARKPQDDTGDKMSKKSKQSGTESNISNKIDNEVPKKSKSSQSNISMKMKDIDIKKDEMSKKPDGKILSRDYSLNDKPSNKLDNISAAEKNDAVKTISGTSSCIDCPPCSSELKIVEKKNAEKWKRMTSENRDLSPDDSEIGSARSSSSMVIEPSSYSHSEKDAKGRRKIGTIAISVRVNYPPCSNDVNNNIPKKTSDQLKSIFSEIGALIAETNMSKIESKEYYQNNTGDKEDISRVDYTLKSDVANVRVDDFSDKLQSISEEMTAMDIVKTNGDSDGEFSPAPSIFETKIKKTSLELNYMASRTRRLSSRVISSKEDVFQIGRSVSHRNSTGNDRPNKEKNIMRSSIVSKESATSSSKLNNTTAINYNPNNQSKEIEKPTNPNSSSADYLAHEEDFIARKLSNKAQNSSRELNTPMATDNNSHSQPNRNNSEVLNNKISKRSSSGDPQPQEDIFITKKPSTRLQSLSEEVYTPMPTDNSSYSQSESEKARTSNRRSSRRLSSADQFKEENIMERKLSSESKSSSREVNVNVPMDDVANVEYENKKSEKWDDNNRKISSSFKYESNEENEKERKLSGGENKSAGQFEEENGKQSSENDITVRRHSRKSQGPSGGAGPPTTMDNISDDKSKEEKIELINERNDKHSFDYQYNEENIRARKSSNESKRSSAEKDTIKLTDMSSDNKIDEDQTEMSNRMKISSVIDQLNEEKSTVRRDSSELRTTSENINTASPMGSSPNRQIATVEIEIPDEKRRNSSLAGELVSSKATHDDEISDKLKRISTEENASLSPNITSNYHLKEFTSKTAKTENTEKSSIVSNTSHSHGGNDVQKSIATKSSGSQSELDDSKIQSSSSVDYQPHFVDRNDIKKQQFNTNAEINTEKLSDILAHQQSNETEPRNPDKENRTNPQCINHKPFSTDIKIIVKQLPLELKSISSNLSESLPEVIHGHMQSMNMKSSGNSICVDCPPCSNVVRVISYQSSNELNGTLPQSELPNFVNNSTKKELSMPKKPSNISRSISKETNESTSVNVSFNTTTDEKSLIVDNTAHSNEEKPTEKKSTDRTSLSANFSLGSLSKDDIAENEKDSQNSLPADYLPISEERNTVPKQFSDKRSHPFSKARGSLPSSCSGQSGEYKMQQPNIKSSENSLCVDCPPCFNKVENVSEESSSVGSELFTESKLSDINARIQVKRKQKNSLRTETSRSASRESYSQNESVRMSKKESYASRSISEVTNNGSFTQSNRGKQELCNPKSSENSSFDDLPHQDESNTMEKKSSKANTEFSESMSSDITNSGLLESPTCIDCPPCSPNFRNMTKKLSDKWKKNSPAITESSRSGQHEQPSMETSENSFCANCPPCSNGVEMPIILSNLSSNVWSKSSENESYYKKTSLSKSSTISDASSSTVHPEEAETKERSEIPPIGDCPAQCGAISSREKKEIAKPKTADEFQIIPKDTKKSMSVNIKSKTESKEFEIDVMKTFNKKNSQSSRSNEVNRLVISILDFCTSKIFSPEATSIASDSKNIVPRQKFNKENDEIVEENIISNECIDFYLNLITERFKMKAMDVDDDEFERMFEELTEELNTLFCQCGKINPDIFEKSLSYIQTDIEDDRKNNREPSTNFIKEENLKEMFNEMKLYFEDKLCSCKNKDVKAESRIIKAPSLTIEAEEIPVTQTNSESSKRDISSIISNDEVSTTNDKPSNLGNASEILADINQVETKPTDYKIEMSDSQKRKNKINDEIIVQSDSHNELNNSTIKKIYQNVNDHKPSQNFSQEKIAQSNYSNDNDEIEMASKNTENKNFDDSIANITNDESDVPIGIITSKKQNDDNDLTDNKSFEEQKNIKRSEEIIQDQQEVTEDEDMIFKAQKVSKITKENETTVPQTSNNALDNENKFLVRSDTGSIKISNNSEEDTVKEEHEITSRNSGISKKGNMKRVSKKDTFESYSKPSITDEATVKAADQMAYKKSNDGNKTFKKINSDIMKQLNYSGNQDVMEGEHKSIRAIGDENLETFDKKETFVTNAKPSITKNISESKNEMTHNVDIREINITNDERGLERLQWKDDDDDFHSATTCSEVYEQGETYLTLLDKVAMNPMKLSDLFPRQIQLVDHSGNSSNHESFFTAECPYFYEVSKLSTVYAQRMIAPSNLNNCCLDKQVGTYEYTAKSRTYQDGRIFRIEPNGEELAEVAIKKEKDEMIGNVDKIKVRIRLTDERNSKKTQPSVGRMTTGTEMTINRSRKFSHSLTDFNVKYETIQEKIVDETKVVTDGDNIKIFIPLDSDDVKNENK